MQMMGFPNSYGQLVLYKLRHVGLWNTLRVGYLDVSEMILCHLAKRISGRIISPRSIQIECTTRCNLKCTMCEISYWNDKGGDLQTQNLQKMVDHLPNLKRVDLTGVGEALMNRAFFKALEILKSRGLYITLNDNFTLMNEKAARRIVELGIDQVFLSLDGATKETYEQIRAGANFDKVIANVRRLIQIKRNMRKKEPEVKINTVVCSTNYRELPAIIELAHEIGVGMVQLVNVITFEGTSELQTDALQREVGEKIQEARDRAKELAILVKVELFDKLPVQQCNFPWKRNFVTYDGYVHPCCYTTQNGDRKSHNSRSLGNLVDSSFAELWSGELYSAFRKKMALGILPYQCQHCPKYSGNPDAATAQITPEGVVALTGQSGAVPRISER
jgi:MoaA/NifB/PqqE/SkfB family radical SAM enzyme